MSIDNSPGLGDADLSRGLKSNGASGPHVQFPKKISAYQVVGSERTDADRRELNIDLYRKIYLIRKSEEGIIENYASDSMKTPMHMSMGGESISAGVCHALAHDDQVMGSYRSHALYLSKTMDPVTFFAEMYGKETGCARGKAGSMHLASLERGMVGSSAVVAAHIPVAVGQHRRHRYT